MEKCFLYSTYNSTNAIQFHWRNQQTNKQQHIADGVTMHVQVHCTVYRMQCA